MLYTIEKPFVRILLTAVLLACLIPQIFCVGLRYINEYQIAENVDFGILSEIIDVVVQIVGTASAFSAYSIIIYSIFHFGIKGGGELLIAVFGGYAVVYFLIMFISSLTFGVAAGAVWTAVLIAFFFARLKGAYSPSVLIIISTFLPYVGGVIILFTTVSYTGHDLLSYSVYGLLNFSLDMVMLTVAEQTASVFRSIAVEKKQDITVGGSYIPKRRPVLKAILTTDIIYVVITLTGCIVETVPDLSEYGWPVNGAEWLNISLPYIKTAVLSVVAYFVSAFIVNRLEDGYFRCSDRAELMNRSLGGKK